MMHGPANIKFTNTCLVYSDLPFWQISGKQAIIGKGTDGI